MNENIQHYILKNYESIESDCIFDTDVKQNETDTHIVLQSGFSGSEETLEKNNLLPISYDTFHEIRELLRAYYLGIYTFVERNDAIKDYLIHDKLLEQNKPKGPTFHERKAERKEYYEKYLKYWKLRDCSACNGTGVYDNDGRPTCGACEGTGKERYRPHYENAQTDIDKLIGKTLRMEVSSTSELHVRIRNRREVIYQFVGTDDHTKDPRFRTSLHFGYDTVDHVEDWYFEDTLGIKCYLFQFDTIG